MLIEDGHNPFVLFQLDFYFPIGITLRKNRRVMKRPVISRTFLRDLSFTASMRGAQRLERSSKLSYPQIKTVREKV